MKIHELGVLSNNGNVGGLCDVLLKRRNKLSKNNKKYLFFNKCLVCLYANKTLISCKNLLPVFK